MPDTTLMKTVQIQYYALLREERGLSEESFSTDALTPEALYEQLQAKYGLSLPVSRLGVSVNEAFAAWDTALQDGDRVVFIPPVAGG